MSKELLTQTTNKDIVLTYIKRFEQSPYLSCYDRPGIVSGVYAGRFFQLYYGDDSVEKYCAWLKMMEGL